MALEDGRARHIGFGLENAYPYMKRWMGTDGAGDDGNSPMVGPVGQKNSYRYDVSIPQVVDVCRAIKIESVK